MKKTLVHGTDEFPWLDNSISSLAVLADLMQRDDIWTREELLAAAPEDALGFLERVKPDMLHVMLRPKNRKIATELVCRRPRLHF